jgi:hypothetical protein
MNNFLKYALIIVLSITVGWLFGFYFSIHAPTKAETIYQDKVKTKVVRDTVKVKQLVFVDKEVTDSTENQDDTTQYLDDSLDSIALWQEDSLDFDDSGEIITEQLITSKKVHIDWVVNDSLDISELLNKKASSFNETIIVEYWQSPLNLTGYLLNRNKLKLFGFNPDEPITLQVLDEKNQLILKSSSFLLRLSKSSSFKSIEI